MTSVTTIAYGCPYCGFINRDTNPRKPMVCVNCNRPWDFELERGIVPWIPPPAPAEVTVIAPIEGGAPSAPWWKRVWRWMRRK